MWTLKRYCESISMSICRQRFPIQDAEESVDYKPIAIAGKDFMLPFHSEVRMSYDRHRFTNRIDFKAYHKFSTKSDDAR